MNWERKQLCELGVVTTGSTPKTSSPEFYNGEVPFVTPADLDTGSPITETARTLTTRGAAEARILPSNAVLVSCIGTLGKVGIAGCELATNQQINSIVFDTAKVFPRYGYYACRRLKPLMETTAPATTLPIISKSKFQTLEIPIPPLAEQKRIAGILDAADALRAKRREALAQLDTLLRATFLDLFGDPVINPKGWDTDTIENLVEGIESGWSPTCLERPPQGDEWGVLKLGAVTYCEFREGECKALPSNQTPRPELEVKKGDVLFTRKNTYELVAACAFVRATRPKLMLSDLIFRLPLRCKRMESAFAWQQLIVPRLRRLIQSFAGGSAGSMPNISKAKLQTIRLIVPPIGKQQQFAEFVESVERQREAQRTHLAELDTLFASLQSRAFRGELNAQ